MDVTVTPPPPAPPPPPVYDITGLTEDEALFLRDLLGRFSCASQRSEPRHGHSVLYNKLAVALKGNDTRYKFETTDYGRYDPVLRCSRLDEGDH